MQKLPETARDKLNILTLSSVKRMVAGTSSICACCGTSSSRPTSSSYIFFSIGDKEDIPIPTKSEVLLIPDKEGWIQLQWEDK